MRLFASSYGNAYTCIRVMTVSVAYSVCAYRASTPSLAVASAVHHVTQMSADPLYTWAAARWVLCVLGQRGSLTVVSERLFVFCVAAPGVDPMLCAVSSTIEF